MVNTGSTGRIAEELGKLAISKGWQSYIAVGRAPYVSASEVIKVGDKFDMYSHVLETRVCDNHAFGSRKATKSLVKEIEKIDPDIIHLHNLHGYYVNVEILFEFLRRLGKPVVWTLHDCWPFTGHCAFYEYVGCEKWKTECHHCPQTQEYPKSWYYDNSASNFRRKKDLFNSLKNVTIVPVSDWLGSQLQQSFLQGLPLRRIHNGVDLKSFRPEQKLENPAFLELKKGKFIILGVANLWEEKRKGLQDFLELAKRVESDHLIILVGLKKKYFGDLPPNVIGIERTENVPELAALYAASDVLFNPTWEDNFPTTNLEALACGTPVITYKTGGSVEVITQDTGYIVTKGDIEGAVASMKLIKQKGKAHYRERCREYALRFLNKDERFNEYFEVYTSLLKQIQSRSL